MTTSVDVEITYLELKRAPTSAELEIGIIAVNVLTGDLYVAYAPDGNDLNTLRWREFGPEQAVEAKNAAIAARDAAIAARDAANTSATNAATSASEAETAKTGSETARDRSITAAQTAERNVAIGEAAVRDANNFRQQAATSETNAATSASNASDSATQAATSASNAANSATDAANSATRAEEAGGTAGINEFFNTAETLTSITDSDHLMVGTPGRTRDVLSDLRVDLTQDLRSTPFEINLRDVENYYFVAAPNVERLALGPSGSQVSIPITPFVIDTPMPVLLMRDIRLGTPVSAVIIIEKPGSGLSRFGRAYLLVPNGEAILRVQADWVIPTPRPGNARAEHNYPVNYAQNLGSINGLTADGYTFVGTEQYPINPSAYLGNGMFNFRVYLGGSQTSQGIRPRYSIQLANLTRINTAYNSAQAPAPEVANYIDKHYHITDKQHDSATKNAEQDRAIAANKDEADANLAAIDRLSSQTSGNINLQKLGETLIGLSEVSDRDTVIEELAIVTTPGPASGAPAPEDSSLQEKLANTNVKHPIPFINRGVRSNPVVYSYGFGNPRGSVRSNTQLGYRYRDNTIVNPSYSPAGNLPVIYKNGAAVTDDAYGVYFIDDVLAILGNKASTFDNVDVLNARVTTHYFLPRFMANGEEVLENARVSGDIRLPGGQFRSDLLVLRNGVRTALGPLHNMLEGDILVKSTPERPNYLPALTLDANLGVWIEYQTVPERGGIAEDKALKSDFATLATARAFSLNGSPTFGFAWQGDIANLLGEWGYQNQYVNLLFARFIDRLQGALTRRPGVRDPRSAAWDFTHVDQAGISTTRVFKSLSDPDGLIQSAFDDTEGNTQAKFNAVGVVARRLFFEQIANQENPLFEFTDNADNFDLRNAELVSGQIVSVKKLPKAETEIKWKEKSIAVDGNFNSVAAINAQLGSLRFQNLNPNKWYKIKKRFYTPRRGRVNGTAEFNIPGARNVANGPTRVAIIAGEATAADQYKFRPPENGIVQLTCASLDSGVAASRLEITVEINELNNVYASEQTTDWD